MNTPTPEKLSALIRAAHYFRDDSFESSQLVSYRLANNCDIHDTEGHGCEAVARYYGIPGWLVHLQDALFENADKNIFVKLTEAIKPRDNWQSVMHAIQRRMLTEVVLPNAGSSTDLVQTVIDLHAQESTNYGAWAAACSDALSARRPARSAPQSAAMFAAWSTEWSTRLSVMFNESPASGSAAEIAVWSVESAESAESAPAAWKAIMDIVLEEVAR